MTNPVTLSMTCETCSTQSMTVCAFEPNDAAAAPKKTEKITICRISLLAKASNALRGTRCVTNSFSDIDDVFRFDDVPTSGNGRFSDTPGWRTLTRNMPSSSENSDAVTNQPMVLRPIRPIALVSPMCAMPTTSVENTSGAMIILIRRRKMSVNSEIYPATVLADSGVGRSWLHIQPTAMPASMAKRIHVVSFLFFMVKSPPRDPLPAQCLVY